jgi:hypothetical protein
MVAAVIAAAESFPSGDWFMKKRMPVIFVLVLLAVHDRAEE